MLIPKEKIEEITSRIDLAELIGQYVSLRSNGGRYIGLCPFHAEKTPSFNVNPAQGFYHCFGCKESGDAFKFLMKIEGLSFTEAAEKLAAKTGVSLEAHESAPEDKEKTEISRLFSRITTSFVYFLEKSPEGEIARRTLEKRKISSESIKKFQLGYAPSDRRWLFRFLLEKNYTRDFLARTGLFSQRYPETSLFSSRLIFPIKNHRGDFVAFGGRLLGEADGPKYLNSPENPVFKKRSLLYALDLALPEIRKKKEAHLCEGYMDVIALHQAGVQTAVAPLGTALTEEHLQFLRRYVERVFLVFDTDEAGKKATIRTLELCERWDLEAWVVSLPSAKDPAEILEKQGEGELQNSLKSPINSFDFLLDFYYYTFNQAVPMDVGGFLRAVFQYLEAVPSDVRKETLLSRAAEKLKVSKENLLRDFSRRTERVARFPEFKTVRPAEKVNNTDFFIMTAVLGQMSLFPLVRRDLTEEDLEDVRAVMLFSALNAAFAAGETSLEGVLSRINRDDLKEMVLSRLSKGEFEGNPEKMIQDGVLMIRKRSLEKKRADIVLKLNNLGSIEGDRDQVLPLMQEIKFLDGEIKKIKVIHND